MTPAPGRSPPALRSLPGLAWRLAAAWWPQLAALAAACAVVAATIVGALGVGDALERGLRGLALERLGGIDAAVIGDEPFRRGLAAELAAGADPLWRVVPALVLDAVVDAGASGGAAATLLGCDDPAALGFEPTAPAAPADGVLVNAPLAAALGVAAGDFVVLRVPERSAAPADSPLGRRAPASRSRRLRVAAVLAAAGLGRFSLQPRQVTAPLAVTTLGTAQALVRRGDVANAALAVATGPRPTSGATPDAGAWLAERLRPRLEDFGLALAAGGPDAAAVRLTSRRLLLPAEVDRAAAAAFAAAGGQPSLVLLANDIVPLAADGTPAAARVPYSTVLGIAATPLPSGTLVDDAGAPLPPPGDDEIVVDRWLADDLAAQGHPLRPGDRVALHHFLPETVRGRVAEAEATLRVAGIAAMQGAAVVRDLVPDVEGVTDEASIADWDPPFPFDRARVRTTPPHDEDDRYWKRHGATPKAFVSLATARRLAGSRFGVTTAWHVPRAGVPDVAAAAQQLAAALPAAALGIRVEPLRARALAAARGSTPFGTLFLALSSFVVIAALLLAWLLFALLVAARRHDIGVLAAVGWAPARIARLLLLAAGLAAVVGVTIGTLVGPGWATALVALLASRWNAAVAAGADAAFGGARPGWAVAWPGAAAALLLSLVALAVASARAGRLAPRALLQGGGPLGPAPRGRHGARIVAAAGLAAAAAAALAGRAAEAGAAVGLFFAAGAAALVGMLALVRGWLAAAPATGLRSLPGLARRTLGHAPGRAFAVAALVACAQFLLVAVSSFAQRPPARPEDRSSPTGGWTTIATFGAASAVDPTDPALRESLGLAPAGERAVAACTIALLRSSAGDDASCTNLYAAPRPMVLGVGPDFVARGGFRFVDHERPDRQLVAGNHWTLLGRPADAPDAPIPAILDEATARWALRVGGVGAEFELPDDAGRPLRLRVVGLLEPGILQGAVLVAERDFERAFPARSGYGMALIDATALEPAARSDLDAALRGAWADAGVTLVSALDRLRGLQAVQNTFLAGFQALGTLGLLLGTAGVAAVQLQGVLERAAALALLGAIGFAPARVRGLIVLETCLMVAAGLTAGTAAACLAVAPALAAGAARVPVAWIAVTVTLTLAVALAVGATAASRAGKLRVAAEP